MIGNGDHIGLVLDDEDRIALVAQLLHEPGETAYIVGMKPDAGFVKDIEHVGEAGAQMADHLHPLAFTTRQRRAFAVEREITQPDGHEVFQPRGECIDHRRDRRHLKSPDEFCEVRNLHGRAIGDVLALDAAVDGTLIEAGTVTARADLAGEDALILGADMGLEAFGILVAQRLLELGNKALIGEVDLVDLDLAGIVELEKIGAFLFGVVPDGFVIVEKAGAGVGRPPPGIDIEAPGQQGPFVERFGLVDHSAHVHRRDLADSFTFGAHAARIVEGIKAGRAEMGFGDARKDDPQHLGCVGDRCDGRTRIAAEALLVDDDGRRDVGKGIGVGLAVMGHELLNESGIGFVDQPLGFSSDGAKNQRGFARARNAGKDCDLAFGDIDGDVFEIVFARAADFDRAVHEGPLLMSVIKDDAQARAEPTEAPQI